MESNVCHPPLPPLTERELLPQEGGAGADRLQEISPGRLRRGPSVILPPPFSFTWRFPIENQMAVTNDGPPSYIHRPSPVAAPGRASPRSVALLRRPTGLRVSYSKSALCGTFVWARRGLNRRIRRFPAPRAAACLVHDLLSQKVTSPRFTTLKTAVSGPGSGCSWPRSSSTRA